MSFKAFGWIYRPVSLYGWIVTVLAVVFCTNIFFIIDRASHSVSDTLYGIFPYIVPAFGFWYWVASKLSKKE